MPTTVLSIPITLFQENRDELGIKGQGDEMTIKQEDRSKDIKTQQAYSHVGHPARAQVKNGLTGQQRQMIKAINSPEEGPVMSS